LKKLIASGYLIEAETLNALAEKDQGRRRGTARQHRRETIGPR
jgi:hypothetical protein